MDNRNISDYDRKTTDYEPNFVLKDHPAKPASDEPSSARDDMLSELERIAPKKDEPVQRQSAPESTAPGSDTQPEQTVRPGSVADAARQPQTGAGPAPRQRTGADGVSHTTQAGADTAGHRPSAGTQPGINATRPSAATQPGIGATRPSANTQPGTQPGINATRPSAGAQPGTGAARPSASSHYRAGARTGSYDSSRPRFENPSYDDGISGSGTYRDPRSGFSHYGESASWSNGETSRRRGPGGNRKRPKGPAKTVTLTKGMMALLVAGCLFLSCLFGLGGGFLANTLTGPDMSSQTPATTGSAKDEQGKTETTGYSLDDATGSNMTVKEITAAAKDSVVEIRTGMVSSDSWMQEYVTEGAGSGVIISEDGYIMTNNHVIEGADTIKVTTSDEKEYEAKLVGTDENNDVAVIKIDASGLKPANYGNSDQLEVGDLAVAIGNPLGELGGTVTAGIISATDRELSIDGKTLHLLQTDSSINPGNSGGGLFNGDGQLIGLVVAKSAGSDVEGLGFAIPINKAANVAQQLMDKGYVSGQPSTGMTYKEGSSQDSSFGSFDSIFGGSSATQVYIYSVNGENAKKAGFEAGDIVAAVDDKEITSFDDLTSVITAHQVGDKVTFTVIRNGSEKKIKLTLEEKQADNNQPADQGAGESPENSAPESPSDEQQIPGFPEDNGGGSFFDFFFGQ